jgi:hypothetical protein
MTTRAQIHALPPAACERPKRRAAYVGDERIGHVWLASDMDEHDVRDLAKLILYGKGRGDELHELVVREVP